MGHAPLTLRLPHPFGRVAPKSGVLGRAAPRVRGDWRRVPRRLDPPRGSRGRSKATLRPSRNHYVRGFCRRDLLGASIAERFSVDACEKVLPLAQQNRRNGDVHLVDQPCLKVLPDRSDAATQPSPELCHWNK